MKKFAIVLAAGKGVRMKSDLPKVSHPIFGKPMIVRVLEALDGLKLDGIVVVVGYKSETVMRECEGFDVSFALQEQQLGTGHAVMQARQNVSDDSVVFVLNGDVPMIRTATLKALMEEHLSSGASATVLTAEVDDPGSYGRIVRSADGRLEKIVEQKDATKRELEIREVNTGTYCFNSTDLFDALGKIKPNNSQKEYYLTDVMGVMNADNKRVTAFLAEDPSEALGVNTIEDLARLEEIFRNAERH